MAARFFVAGGVTTNWSDILNWSLTSGGAGGQAVPLVTDDVTLDANSPNCTLDTTARICKSLTATNYTNTLTFTNNLSVSGAITLGASMVFAGALSLIAHSTATLTSNGKTVGVPMIFDAGASYTLGDNWQTSSNVTISSTASSFLGSKNFTIGGSFLITAASTTISSVGTTIIMNGTGNFGSSGGIFNGNVTFNTAGTITQTSHWFCSGGTITYTAGTIDTSGAFDLRISGAGCTLNTNGMSWYNVVNNTTASTITLTSNLQTSNLTNSGASGTCIMNGLFNISVSSVVSAIGSNIWSGTATIVSTGGTVIQSGVTTTGGIRNNLTFAGNSTVSGSIAYGTGTITYTSGTITTSGSNINVLASCTFNTNGINWDSIAVTGGGVTITINSLLSVNLTSTSQFSITTGNSCTFAGTAGWTVSALKLIPPTTSIVLTVGNTYTVVNTIDFVGWSGGNAQISSATPGVKATLNLTAGISQLIAGASITNVDSSGGTQALVYKGTLSNTTNWVAFTSAGNGPGTFIDLNL